MDYFMISRGVERLANTMVPFLESHCGPCAWAMLIFPHASSKGAKRTSLMPLLLNWCEWLHNKSSAKKYTNDVTGEFGI